MENYYDDGFNFEHMPIDVACKFFEGMSTLTYYCDNQRHLICKPYSKKNLHKMADDLGIKRCWFHKDHYDIPKTRINEIMIKCEVVSSKMIFKIINE